MDAQILHEVIWIRWLVTAIAVAVVVFAAAYVISFGAAYIQKLAEVKTGDFFDRGNSLLNRGRLDELLGLCDKHLVEFPADAGAHWLKANAHYRRKEWNQALVSYRKAQELQPGWVVGSVISELEDAIRESRTSGDLKIVAPVAEVSRSSSPRPKPDGDSDA